MFRLVIAAVLSAVVLFVWGFLYWAALPLPFLVLSSPPNAADIVSTLKNGNLESGVYLIPWCSEADKTARGQETVTEEVMKRQKEGPLVQITYRKDGVDPMNPIVYVIGFVHFLIASLLLAVLLKMALPGLESYGARVLFVFLAGLFASVTIDLSQPIWFHHPWSYPLFNAVYHLGIGLLSGLVLAALIKPQR